MWTIVTLLAWLEGLGILDDNNGALRFVDGTRPVPKMADQLCIVTPTGGPGETMQGMADTVGAQLRWRGRQRTGDSVGLIARRADNKIRFAQFPTRIITDDGPVQLLTVQRAGGPPALLTGTPDAPSERAEYTCNYNITVMEAQQ